PRSYKLPAHLRAKISWHEYLREVAMSLAIVRLDGPVEPELSELPADRLIAGAPEVQVRNFFTDPSQQFFAGRWSATRGNWRVPPVPGRNGRSRPRPHRPPSGHTLAPATPFPWRAAGGGAARSGHSTVAAPLR